MKKWRSLLLCTVFVLSLVLSLGNVSLAAQAPAVIEIFHTNDVHGAAVEAAGKDGTLTNMGFARLKAYMDAQPADGKLLLDAGDILQGLPFATVPQGDTMAQLVQAMGYQAVAPGNHDFDYGAQRLMDLQKKYNLPLLSANLTKGGGPLFPGSQVFEVGGIKVGVFGLTTPETAYKTNPNNVVGLSFGSSEEVLAAAKAAVTELREKKGAQVVVALTHLGSEEWAQPSARQLATAVPGIDLIIDGHSHSTLDGGIKVGNTVITSTGDSLKNLGVVKITVAADKTITIVPSLVSAAQLTKVEPDPTIAALCKSLGDGLAPELSKVVATAPVPLDGQREHVRGGSTNLGRLIAHAMMDETKADVAIINGGSIRTSIPQGPVTKGDLVAVLPFGNIAVTVQVPGSAIRRTLEDAMVAQEGAFPQFAGMTVTATVQEKTNGEGGVYTQYIPSTIEIGGKPLDESKTYTVAINDYMFVGGDKVYQPLAQGTLLGEYSAIDEIFIRYMAKADMAAIDQEQLLVLSGLTGQAVTAEAKNPGTGGAPDSVFAQRAA